MEWLTILVVIAIVALFFVFRRRSEENVDVTDPDKVLQAVEVYEAYGRQQQALELVQRALRENPNYEGLKAKRDELGSTRS